MRCVSVNCFNDAGSGSAFCNQCNDNHTPKVETSLSAKYPQYFKNVSALTEVDVYQVHNLFEIDDASGCIHHASKKLLLSGVRTGGKSKYQDIKEARDTLNRWLELNS